MDSGILARIRRAVRENRYQMTDHALEEADADDLTLDALRNLLLTGDLDATLTDDARGPRYVIRGGVGGSAVALVCRFRRDDRLLIVITVYAVD